MRLKLIAAIFFVCLASNMSASVALDEKSTISRIEEARKIHQSVASGWADLSKTGKIINVHSISKTFIRTSLPKLYEADKLLRGHEVKPMSWEDFQKSVQTFGIAFPTMHAKLKQYYATVDGESQAHMATLLTRVWMLSQMFDDEPLMFQDNIESNVEEQGGCCAGVAVRLTPMYMRLIGHFIQEKERQNDLPDCEEKSSCNEE